MSSLRENEVLQQDERKENSIIMAFHISEKKWNKYLRNKIILYKKL